MSDFSVQYAVNRTIEAVKKYTCNGKCDNCEYYVCPLVKARAEALNTPKIESKRPREQLTKYRVYDHSQNDKLIGEFTINEIAEMTGIQPKSVRESISRDSYIVRRYYCTKVKDGRWEK